VEYAINQDMAEGANPRADECHRPADDQARLPAPCQKCQPPLGQVFAGESGRRPQHQCRQEGMRPAVPFALAGENGNQRLQVHHNLRPAENHQAETAPQDGLDENPRSHVIGCEWHLVSPGGWMMFVNINYTLTRCLVAFSPNTRIMNISS